MDDMMGRYARTGLGPFWNLLNNAIFVAALGFTFGAIFNADLSEFLPYIAASMAIWGYINGMISDGPTAFVRARGLITTYSLPLTVQAFRLVIDKIIMFMLFLIVYVVVVLIFPQPISSSLFLFVPGLLVLCVFGFGLTLILGTLGVRFRDIAPALQSMSVLFFLLTPILWQKRPGMEAIVMFNPLYHLLELLRGPLMGYYPTALNWKVSIGVSIGVLIIGVLVFVKGRRYIFYWL